MNWHPGGNSETAQQVELTFQAHGDETLVTLHHRNFERLGEGAAETRGHYDSGWSAVLQLYQEALP